MPKIKYDVSNAEVRNFEVPKPGVYEAHIHEISHGKSSSDNPMFTVVFEITKGDYKGSRIWHYILTDGSQEWRMREFTDALSLKPKGELDTDAVKGTVVRIKTAIEPPREGYDEKARIKNVLPPDTASSGGGGSDDDEDEPPYEEWELDELKEEAEAREIKIAGRATKKKLIDALEADDASNGDDEEEEEEEEDEEEEEEEGEEDSLSMEELKGMSRNELKALIKEEELDIKVVKSKKDDDLRNEIAEALDISSEEDAEEEEDEEEEEDDENEKDTDYDSWDVSDLKAELKERGLKTDGRKSVLVQRLKKDDAADGEPF